MPSPDTLATIALVAFALLGAYGITRIEEGAATRAFGGEHTGRHVRPATVPRQPHARPLVHHAAPRGWSQAARSPLAITAGEATEPIPAVTTTPDPKPFARTSC